MEIERDKNRRMIIWLNFEDWRVLVESLEAVERISWSALTEKGYDNLILDYPIGRVIAAYKGEYE